MGDLAKKHLQNAVNAYKEDDEASNIGCFRDAITDILHLVRKDFPVMDLQEINEWILESARTAFEEELEQSEIDLVQAIPDSQLPLQNINELEFNTSKLLLEERLKGKSDEN